jgi:DNA-binding MarR family transcriptional regulator
VSKKRWLTDDERTVWMNFTLMQLQLFAYLGDALSPTGLSFHDYGVLARLTEVEDGQARLNELAQMVGFERSRMSHHANRMQARGLVERVKCATDLRGAYIRITASGRAAIVAAAPDHVAAVRHQVFDHLTPEQVRTLGDIAKVILENLPPEIRTSQPNVRSETE